MQVIADLHIHSKYSRATSKDMDLKNIEKYAKIKGLDLVGSGDFTHPKWLNELKQNLKEDGGILKTKDNFSFILQTEVSLMYSKTKSIKLKDKQLKDKPRRVHLIIFAPNFEIVDKINRWLQTKGRLDYDGRPIFNISCSEFTGKLIEISEEIEIIPAHCMTPWFGIFGSESGFDSLEEAFEEKTSYIHAVESGMSADPEMLWRLEFLDDKAIVSFSDSHSYWPWRLGREATVFQLKEDFSYSDVIHAIRKKKIAFTIETSPSYGKYHFDGHRSCNFSCSPEEAEKNHNICPVCNKPLTIGVLHRIEKLAHRKAGFKPKSALPFKTLLPLHEIIATLLKTTPSAKIVWQEYNKLIEAFGNEFNVLLNAPIERLASLVNKKLVDAIIKNREGKIKVIPGYDGVYGKVLLENQAKLNF